MPTDKRRLTLYVDDKIAKAAEDVADELGLSVSALTRHLYLATASSFALWKHWQAWLQLVEERYDGEIPEEEQAAFTVEMIREGYEHIHRWADLVHPLFVEAGLTAPGDVPPKLSFDTLMLESLEKIEGMDSVADQLRQAFEQEKTPSPGGRRESDDVTSPSAGKGGE